MTDQEIAQQLLLRHINRERFPQAIHLVECLGRRETVSVGYDCVAQFHELKIVLAAMAEEASRLHVIAQHAVHFQVPIRGGAPAGA